MKDQNKTKAQLLSELSELRKRTTQIEDFQGEEKYKQFFGTSTDCVFITSKDGHLIDLNDAGIKLFGYSSREEMMQVRVSDLYANPEERAKHINIIAEKGFTKEFPTDLIRKDGTVIHSLITSVPWYDKESNVAGFQGTIRDITERKRSEEALRTSQLQLLEAMDLARIVYWEFDPVAQTFVLNDPFYAFYGTTAEQEGGYLVSTEDYPKRFIHPDDIALYHQFREENTLRPDTKLPVDLEHRIVRRDGEVRHILARTRVIKDDAGRIVKRCGANQDITERKLKEEKLKFTNILLSTQQEASIDGILVVDENARIISYNRRFVEMWGLPTKLVEDEIDKPVLEFVTAQLMDPKLFIQKVQYLYEHRQETSSDELTLANGQIFERYSAPMFGSDNQYYGRVWYFRDITERKLAGEKIQYLATHDVLTGCPTARCSANC